MLTSSTEEWNLPSTFCYHRSRFGTPCPWLDGVGGVCLLGVQQAVCGLKSHGADNVRPGRVHSARGGPVAAAHPPGALHTQTK